MVKYSLGKNRTIQAKRLTLFSCFVVFWVIFLVNPLRADIAVQCGNLRVKFSAKASWTIRNISKNEKSMCNFTGSAQGSVIRVDGEFAGSGHLNEKLTSALIDIDGVEQEIANGNTYTGRQVRLTRKSTLGGAYSLVSVLTITPGQIKENVHFRGLDAAKNCSIFYAFLGSRANRLTEYITFNPDGSISKQGRSDRDDKKHIELGERAVAQLDPDSKDGMLTLLTKCAYQQIRSFIWDREWDNKLYFRIKEIEGPASPANHFEFEKLMIFVKAEDDLSKLVCVNLSGEGGSKQKNKKNLESSFKTQGDIRGRNENRLEMLPATKAPLIYHIYYKTEYFTEPNYIELFRDSPPDLLHVGKAVPITHHWGPIGLYQGENQYTGGPNRTLSWENIALLSPGQLEDRIQTIQLMLARYHGIGIPEIVPYISYNTIAGDHEKRLGFWSFFDQWEKYYQWAGPPLQHDPFDWLVLDKKSRFVGGACGGYSPDYYAPLHRYRVCINHPDWAEWHRRLIRMIAEVGYDGCFVDNSGSDVCYCRYCQKEFKKFVQESQNIPWVKRMTGRFDLEQIALDSRDLPEELAQRWRWLRARDHLGSLREEGRKIRPGFTIFPNHNRIESALIVGEKSDRLMFESVSIPGFYVPDELERSVLTVEVGKTKKKSETIIYPYKIRDRSTYREMEAEIIVPSMSWVGNHTSLEVNIIKVGGGARDNDVAESINILLRPTKGGDEVKVALAPAGAVGGKGSSRNPRQPPLKLRGNWIPEKSGTNEVLLSYSYTDDSSKKKNKTQSFVEKLDWEKSCRDHVAELLFTQHMRARAIYHSSHLRRKTFQSHQLMCRGKDVLSKEKVWQGWDNVQELALAEMAAFSGGGAFTSAGPAQAEYRKFFKKHVNLFEGWRQYAPAAILYSAWGGNPLSDKRISRSPCVHDILAQSGRLYACLVDSTLSEETEALAAFKVIYLPSLHYDLLPGQINALLSYVRRGGKVVVLENNDPQINGRPAGEVLNKSICAEEQNPGQGQIHFGKPDDLIMATEPIVAEGRPPKNVRFACYCQGHQLCLHTVNYNVYMLHKDKKILNVDPFKVSIPIPSGWMGVKATAYAPEEASKALPCEVQENEAHFTIPGVRIYKIILLERIRNT